MSEHIKTSKTEKKKAVHIINFSLSDYKNVFTAIRKDDFANKFPCTKHGCVCVHKIKLLHQAS